MDTPSAAYMAGCIVLALMVLARYIIGLVERTKDEAEAADAREEQVPWL